MRGGPRDPMAYWFDRAKAAEAALAELLWALDESASANPGRDDVAAMLRYAQAEKAARRIVFASASQGESDA